MNLKEWAEREGVAYVTARRWFAAGKIPVPARKVGGLVLVGDGAGAAPEGVTAVYARVSSAGQKPDLDRQVARVTAWAVSQGLPVGKVVTEVGSALNEKRPKFLALLRDPSVMVIVAEHRDRFAPAPAPAPAQERALRSHAGASRFAWNWGPAGIDLGVETLLTGAGERGQVTGAAGAEPLRAALRRLRRASRARSRGRPGPANRRGRPRNWPASPPGSRTCALTRCARPPVRWPASTGPLRSRTRAWPG